MDLVVAIIILAVVILLLNKPKKGLSGPQGAFGERGLTPDISLQGTEGPIGKPGGRGPNGPQGAAGTRGSFGNTGSLGPLGARGPGILVPTFSFADSLYSSSFGESPGEYVQMLESVDDGISWHNFETFGLNLMNVTSMAFDGVNFVACGSQLPTDDGKLVYFSTDFITWLPIEKSDDSEDLTFGTDDLGNRVAYSACFSVHDGNPLWIVSGVGRTIFAFSPSGPWYSTNDDDITYYNVKYLEFGTDVGFYAVGSMLAFCAALPTSGPFENYALFPTLSKRPLNDIVGDTFALTDIDVVNGTLVLAGYNIEPQGGVVYYSTDGLNTFTKASDFDSPCNSLSTNGAIMVLGTLGFSGPESSFFWSNNGISWTQALVEDFAALLQNEVHIIYRTWYNYTPTGTFKSLDDLNSFSIVNIPLYFFWDGYRWVGNGVVSNQKDPTSYATIGQTNVALKAIDYNWSKTDPIYVALRGSLTNGDFPTIYVSSDLITWVPCNKTSDNFSYDAEGYPFLLGGGNEGTSITWTGQRWIAAGYKLNVYGANNSIMTSLNGLDWVNASGSLNNSQTFVTSNGAISIACSYGSQPLAYSADDGLTWTKAANFPFGDDLSNNSYPYVANKAAWNGSLWVAVGEGAINCITTSLDGINWTPAIMPTKHVEDQVLNELGQGIEEKLILRARDVKWDGTRWIVSGQAASLAPSIVTAPSVGYPWTYINVSQNYLDSQLTRILTTFLSNPTYTIGKIYWSGSSFIAEISAYINSEFQSFHARSANGKEWTLDTGLSGGPMQFAEIPVAYQAAEINQAADIRQLGSGILGIVKGLKKESPGFLRPADVLTYSSIVSNLGDLVET